MELEQAARILPPELRQVILDLEDEAKKQVEEIRLRVGQPVSVTIHGAEQTLPTAEITPGDLERMLELASASSVHTVLESLRRGHLTIEGGHRVGLCGTAITHGGEIAGLRGYSSANIRIARSIPGVSGGLLEALCKQNRLRSTLIIAPSGLGKTTLLRDLVRRVSDGDGCAAMRVSLVDERGEVAALRGGRPQLPVGGRTDVIDGCPKAEGLILLLRAMNPQVMAVDEITAPEDIQALRQAVGCGVVLLATAHGESRRDLERRPLYRELLEQRLFERLVTIRRTGAARHYAVEEME